MKFQPSKKLLSTLLLTLLGAGHAPANDVLIRQQQLANGVIWDYYPGTQQGAAWSPLPISRDGAVFKLIAPAQIAGKSHRTPIQLDATTTGEHFPSGKITIQSEDPHFPPRTRADRPFTVSLDVSGKQTSQKVMLQHQSRAYNPLTHTYFPGGQSKFHRQWDISSNVTEDTAFFSSIEHNDPTLAEGIETFSLHTQAEGATTWHPLQSATIQIFPVASATITGIKHNSVISARNINQTVLDQIDVRCQNLYPDSVTYAQVYRGKEKLGTRGTILRQSVVRFDTPIPQNQTIPLGEWSSSLTDGDYTLEILTITPFNGKIPERLAYVSFTLDRGMHSHGVVSTSTGK